ncbi:MAG: hypothetical protein AAFP07_21905, partial [Cyanobacteria bacterium J06606_4]
AQVEANGLLRDIGHLKRDVEQMSHNVAELDNGYESRFRELEACLSRLSGALDVLMRQGSNQ